LKISAIDRVATADHTIKLYYNLILVICYGEKLPSGIFQRISGLC